MIEGGRLTPGVCLGLGLVLPAIGLADFLPYADPGSGDPDHSSLLNSSTKRRVRRVTWAAELEDVQIISPRNQGRKVKKRAGRGLDKSETGGRPAQSERGVPTWLIEDYKDRERERASSRFLVTV